MVMPFNEILLAVKKRSSLTGCSRVIIVLSKQSFHLVHGLVLHRGKHMTIHVERGRDVAGELL